MLRRRKACLPIPSPLLTQVLCYLRIPELLTAGTISKDWHRFADEDVLWTFWYNRRFGEAPPPRLPRGCPCKSVRELFRERSDCPYVGDVVEVAWQGRFRLENSHVLGGRSWWEARVVARPTGGRGSAAGRSGLFLVHYLAWDTRWDESVPRSRLRWPLDPSDVGSVHKLGPRDVAEVWCEGTYVRGAWLVAPVRKRDSSRLGLRGVLAEGGKKTVIWVSADRCRQVLPTGESKGRLFTRGSLVPSRGSGGSRSGLSVRPVDALEVGATAWREGGMGMAPESSSQRHLRSSCAIS